MRRQSPLALYFLLLLFAVMSMAYYVAGAVALREEWFHGETHARAPFDIDSDRQAVMDPAKAARDAGLSTGDILESVNGDPFTGRAQLNDFVRRAKPGDLLQLGVRNSQGQTKNVRIRLPRYEGPNFGLARLIALLMPILCVPLLGLLVGYWVVAARPRDLNAWLVLVLLSSTETIFSNLDWTFWLGAWYVLFGAWVTVLQSTAFAALLLFGIYFPERWRFDVRWPWMKWAPIATQVFGLITGLSIGYIQFFHAGRRGSLASFEHWTDEIVGSGMLACILLFLAAVFDKLRTASTPDARRRLRVLAVGSALSLGPLSIIFALLPRLGYDPQRLSWLFEIAVPFFAIFPLTLAYVVVVQRAMDLRILLRMGTKYALAKATLVIVEIAIAAFLLVRFIVPMMNRKEHQTLDVLIIVALAVGLFRAFVMRDSLSSRLRRWLDRKFFREAYDAEVVLSELSENARKFTEKGPLIETVSRRISEVLHVPQVAVWLRGGNVFQLQKAVGLDRMGPVLLSDSSATVQNLIRTNRPATLYRERPEGWFTEAGPAEKRALDQVQAELLLPLPGRERLMGVMTLGPKRSEEPYTPGDLRLLQSVAAQTGLSLEVSELVNSLANEAAQRERMNREVEIAREVQQRLFPQRIPQIPGVSLAGRCRPALGVGGDYYDLIELDDGRLGFAIGDVSGKGISAALLMASLRASLRGMALEQPSDLAKMMEKVNRLVYEASASNRYATFFFATYDPVSRELRYVNAGHNAPILMRRADRNAGDPLRLEAGGLVVGLMPGVKYEEQAVTVEAGDVLLAYTDGISEAMTTDDEEWGEERMLAAAQAAQHASAEEILQAVFLAADEFTAGAAQHDDMTLLVLKLES